MYRFAVAFVLSLVVLPVQSRPQPPSETFEAVSIKRSHPSASGFSYVLQSGGRLVLTNGPIAMLIRDAYPADVSELVGAPDWVSSEQYDVTATTAGNPTRDEIRPMLQKLLSERCKLIVHYESQERPVMNLVMARDDHRLGRALMLSKLDCDAVNAARRAGLKPEGPVPENGAPPCGLAQRASDGTMFLLFGGQPMSTLAGWLRGAAGRVVIDKTGLTGNYEFTLQFASRDLGPAPASDDSSVFTALEEQLGLKLVSSRAPIRVPVVDHIDRPSEN
jgi:uncharacterized protein (TIGR03435 family)